MLYFPINIFSGSTKIYNLLVFSSVRFDSDKLEISLEIFYAIIIIYGWEIWKIK